MGYASSPIAYADPEKIAGTGGARMQDQECGNCRYYFAPVCKRMPPCNGSFPVPPDGEDDWCGEWCESLVSLRPPEPSGDPD